MALVKDVEKITYLKESIKSHISDYAQVSASESVLTVILGNLWISYTLTDGHCAILSGYDHTGIRELIAFFADKWEREVSRD